MLQKVIRATAHQGKPATHGFSRIPGLPDWNAGCDSHGRQCPRSAGRWRGGQGHLTASARRQHTTVGSLVGRHEICRVPPMKIRAGEQKFYGVIAGLKLWWLTLRKMNGSLAAFCWVVVSEAPPGEGLGEPEPELWSRDLLLVRALRHESMFHFVMDPACRNKQDSGQAFCQAWSPGQGFVSAGSSTASRPSWQRMQPVAGHGCFQTF